MPPRQPQSTDSSEGSDRGLRFTGIRWGDPLLWIALAAGPVVWVGMAWLLAPELDPAWPLAAPGIFLLGVVAYPVLEEVVFRGLIQDWIGRKLRHKLGPISLANVLTSLLFAMAHLLRQPWHWATLVFIPSLVFGYFRERHATLGTPILLHAFYNLGPIWLFWGP